MKDIVPALQFLTDVSRDLINLSRGLGDGMRGRDVIIETARDLWQMKVNIIMGK